MREMLEFVQYSAAERETATFNAQEWTLIVVDKTEIPQQMNGFDCGVFVIIYADCILRGVDMSTCVDLEQRDVDQIRERLIYSICKGHLLDHALVHDIRNLIFNDD